MKIFVKYYFIFLSDKAFKTFDYKINITYFMTNDTNIETKQGILISCMFFYHIQIHEDNIAVC